MAQQVKALCAVRHPSLSDPRQLVVEELTPEGCLHLRTCTMHARAGTQSAHIKVTAGGGGGAG